MKWFKSVLGLGMIFCIAIQSPVSHAYDDRGMVPLQTGSGLNLRPNWIATSHFSKTAIEQPVVLNQTDGTKHAASAGKVALFVGAIVLVSAGIFFGVILPMAVRDSRD